MSLGAPELIIILVIVLLLFGTTRLPKLARSLGEASKEFQKGANERDRERENEEPAAQAAPPPPVAPVPPPAAPAPPPPASASDPNEQVTMSRAELDALLAEREREAKRDAPPPAQG